MLLHRTSTRCAHERKQRICIYGIIDIENGRFFALHVMDAFSTSCQSGIRHASQQPRASQMSNVCPFPDFLVVPAGTTAVPKTIRPRFFVYGTDWPAFQPAVSGENHGNKGNKCQSISSICHSQKVGYHPQYHHGPVRHLLPSQSSPGAGAAAAKPGFGGDDRCRHAPARRRDDEPFRRHM